MEIYPIVKHIHMTAAVLSLLGFILRGFWMLSDSHLLSKKPVKILPHIIDTILLVAAIYLVVITQMYPFVVNWITAKVLLLVVYIVAGTIALKRGKTKQIKIIAFVIALLSVIGIFGIASVKPALTFL